MSSRFEFFAEGFEEHALEDGYPWGVGECTGEAGDAILSDENENRKKEGRETG